jgi:hypothetical protein
MKLSLKEMNGLLNGKCLPSDLIVGETLAEYLVRKFAEADARCAALAAENGQMLRLLTDISENHDEYVNQDEYLYAGVPMDYVSEINSYVSRDVEAENPFKATDAFLVEMRAQHLQSYADCIAARMKDKSLSMRQKELLNFAWAEVKSYAAELHNAQLRKGVQS